MVKKKKNKKTTRFNKNMLMKSVMSVCSSDPSQSLNYKELANIIGAKDATSKRLINEVLYELVDQKILQEVLTGNFMITKLSVAAEGVVEMERDGNAFVITND